MRLIRHALALFAVIAFMGLFSLDARAGGFAVVDFQRAMNEVKDGEAARAKLEGLYSQKQAEIAQLEQKLQALQQEYQKQELILSDDAKRAKQAEMMQLQQQYQQVYAQSEQQMQNSYSGVMEDLIGKMRDIAVEIGKEKGYTLVLEVTEGGVVYNVDSIDITDELVKRYDARHGG